MAIVIWILDQVVLVQALTCAESLCYVLGQGGKILSGVDKQLIL